ncbi:hypothetical protein AM593_10036, partial [Mytilus galloprovincialis]
LTCDGVDVITNCSDHCQKYSSKDPVPAVIQTTGKDICRCSEDENIPEEIVPTQDTENCTHLIMKFCKYTTMLPSNHVEKMIDKNTAVQGSVYIAIMYKCIPIVRKDGNSQTLEYNTE